MQLLGRRDSKRSNYLVQEGYRTNRNCPSWLFSVHICIHQTAARNSVLSNSITIKRQTQNISSKFWQKQWLTSFFLSWKFLQLTVSLNKLHCSILRNVHIVQCIRPWAFQLSSYGVGQPNTTLYERMFRSWIAKLTG